MMPTACSISHSCSSSTPAKSRKWCNGHSSGSSGAAAVVAWSRPVAAAAAAAAATAVLRRKCAKHASCAMSNGPHCAQPSTRFVLMLTADDCSRCQQCSGVGADGGADGGAFTGRLAKHRCAASPSMGHLVVGSGAWSASRVTVSEWLLYHTPVRQLRKYERGRPV